MDVFKTAQLVNLHLGYFCKKLYQELPKIAQSGHTDPGINYKLLQNAASKRTRKRSVKKVVKNCRSEYCNKYFCNNIVKILCCVWTQKLSLKRNFE